MFVSGRLYHLPARHRIAGAGPPAPAVGRNGPHSHCCEGEAPCKLAHPGMEACPYEFESGV